MKVRLLHATPLWVADMAIAQCYDKPFTYGEANKDRIKRVAVVNKHASTIEHLYYSFYIRDISRALLQQLARHRIASYTVESTRYTLKKLVKQDVDIKKTLVETGVASVDDNNVAQMEALRDALIEGHKNDEVKYMLPEAYKTQLVMTINARSLRNLFELRMDKHAMKEFQALAYQMFAQLPEDHWFLFKDIFDDK